MLSQTFGILAITLMVYSYALENCHPVFLLLFAYDFTLLSFYALLIGSYPFFFAESLWTTIAFRR